MTSPTLSALGGLAIFALDLYAVLRALTRTRGVERTLAWILAIVAFPILGALAYVLLATPNVQRTTRRKRLSTQAVRRTWAIRAAAQKASEPTLEGSLLRLSARLTGLRPSAANRVALLAGNELAFQRIERALARAARSIWAEFYIVGNDRTGRQFLDLLAQKARQGVDVKLLFDAVGSLRIDADRLEAIREAGGRAEAFLPVNPLRRRWAVHLRNHRKLIVVDGKTGFTGGMNIGDQYSGRIRRPRAVRFRDNHLEIQGSAVDDLAQTFAEDWNFATDEHLTSPASAVLRRRRGSVVAIVPSGPDQEHNANALLHFAGIASARERVYLTSPYFVPDEATLRALVASSLRGVDVRILVPARSDLVLLGPAVRSYYPVLTQAGIRIFEYARTALHAKTVVVDGRWAIVGSANLDIRSFRLNFEVGALVVDRSFARALEQRFLADLRDSMEVTPRQVGRRSFAARVGYGVVRLLSPLL